MLGCDLRRVKSKNALIHKVLRGTRAMGCALGRGRGKIAENSMVVSVEVPL